MTGVNLCKMTRSLNRQYWKGFEHDPAMFEDPSKFHTYVYSKESADGSYERQRRMGRIHLAVLVENAVIGEIVLKNIDYENRSCTLGIHLQNDAVKNQGYGTQAERLALEYAFVDLDLQTVFADSLHQNKRSQHVLKKVGFRETHRDATFRYYRCDRV